MVQLYWLTVSLLALAGETGAFAPSYGTSVSLVSTRASSSSPTAAAPTAPPRQGFSQSLLNFALKSPLWKLLLVPQARANIVNTAQANGIPWKKAKAWIKDNMLNKEEESSSEFEVLQSLSVSSVPDYYQKEFHAYEQGNLCWDAAFEVELASAAVGARNFPQYGCQGEDAFRGAFASALSHEAGAVVPTGSVILDMGCGSGMSTRRLARNFPQAKTILGVDLSPYYLQVGKRLLELAPTSFQEGGTWVSTVTPDDRIQYQCGDAANTGLESNSVNVVNLQFVLHELPANAALEVVQEAYRVLKPNGQLWICEMDFQAPAYAEQRANALLFALIRSTEPYLDDYAESITDLFEHLGRTFESTTVVPATGRHYALVATKGRVEPKNGGVMNDLRFNQDGTYRVEDTHLKTWESKENAQ